MLKKTLLATSIVTASLISGTAIAQSPADKLIQQIEANTNANVSYDSIALNNGIRISNLTVQAKPIQGHTPHPLVIDEVMISSFDMDHEIPYFVDFAFNGINIPLDDAINSSERPLTPDELKMINEIGINGQLKANAHLKYTMNEHTDTYDAYMIQGLQNVGNIAINVNLAGAKDVFKQGSALLAKGTHYQPTPQESQAMNQAMSKVTFNGMDFSVRDGGITHKLMSKQAQKEGISLAQLKTNLKAEIDVNLQALREQGTVQPVMVDASSAIKQFIDRPASLSLKIQAKQPISIMESMMGLMMGATTPDQMLNQFNISITYQ